VERQTQELILFIVAGCIFAAGFVFFTCDGKICFITYF